VLLGCLELHICTNSSSANWIPVIDLEKLSVAAKLTRGALAGLGSRGVKVLERHWQVDPVGPYR